VIKTPVTTTIEFGDSPITRQVVDVVGSVLPATYAYGHVFLQPTLLEGDVYPRPGGDESLTISDWVLVGRFVAGLDTPTNSLEFQRADCAPRTSLGDGVLTVSDWVQAGRYAAGLDAAVRIGGPTSAVPQVVVSPAVSPSGRKTQSGRQVALLAPAFSLGQSGSVQVALNAHGDENAIGFSLSFDPTKLAFTGASLGNAASEAVLYVNSNQAAQGRLGLVLALPAGKNFHAGTQSLINVGFTQAAAATGTAALTFGDQPVIRGVADANASTLSADYINAAVVVSPLPALKINTSANTLTLSWPTAAAGFVLQESADASLTSANWTDVPSSPTVANGQSVVSLPVSATKRFYRLYHP
jgi:hypothetical protein